MIWIHHTRGCDKNLTESFFSVNWGQVCLSAWHIQPDRIFSRMKKVTGDMNQWAHSSSSQLVLSTDSQVTAFSRSHHLRLVLCFTKTFIRFWRRYQLLVFGHGGSLECCFLVVLFIYLFFLQRSVHIGKMDLFLIFHWKITLLMLSFCFYINLSVPEVLIRGFIMSCWPWTIYGWKSSSWISALLKGFHTVHYGV